MLAVRHVDSRTGKKNIQKQNNEKSIQKMGKVRPPRISCGHVWRYQSQLGTTARDTASDDDIN